MPILETLYVNILAKTDKFGRQMGFAKSIVSAFKSSFFAMATQVASVEVFRRINNEIHDLERLSTRLDIPYNALEDLKYVAFQTDVSFESLSRGVGEFNKKIGGFKSGKKMTADFINTLTAMGLDINDLVGSSTQGRLLKLMDGFDRLSDTDEKIAASQELFGKSGRQLIDMFLMQRSGIVKLISDRETMLRLQDREIESVKDFNSTWKSSWENITSTLEKSFGRMAPILDLISNVIDRVSSHWAERLEKMDLNFNAFMSTVVTYGDMISRFFGFAGMEESMANYRKKLEENVSNLEKIKNRFLIGPNVSGITGGKGGGLGEETDNAGNKIGTTTARQIDWRNVGAPGVAGTKENKVNDTKAHEILNGIHSVVKKQLSWSEGLGRGSVGFTGE